MNRTMKRMIMPLMALAVFFCSVATGVAEDNLPIRSKQITLPQVAEKPMKIGNDFGGGIHCPDADVARCQERRRNRSPGQSGP